MTDMEKMIAMWKADTIAYWQNRAKAVGFAPVEPVEHLCEICGEPAGEGGCLCPVCALEARR